MKKALMCLSVLVVTNMATASDIKWNTKKISYQNEPTTQATMDIVKKSVEERCASLGGKETVTVLSERTTDQYLYGNQQVFIANPEDNSEICLMDGRCEGRYVETFPGYILRESAIKLVRSNGEKSYEISVQTNWDHDLPMPMATADLKAAECN